MVRAGRVTVRIEFDALSYKKIQSFDYQCGAICNVNRSVVGELG